MGVEIKRTGKAVPARVVKNQELTQFMDTDDQWIVERTGINERRVATEESAVQLAVAAAKQALEGEDYNSVNLVIVATVTPDRLVPAMGALVKRELNLPNAVAFDINIACSGFIYALWMANSLMQGGRGTDKGCGNIINKALIIGVERLSRIVDWKDRNTGILFGDGAGCALLEYKEESVGIISSFMKNYDDTEDSLTCGMEYVSTPFSTERDNPETQVLKMHGNKVFKFAVNAIGEVMEEALKNANMTPDDIVYFVPHQANMRIIAAAAKRFKQPLEKFQICLEKTGNVSAASVPMALDELLQSGKVQKGDKLMLMGFGGGLSAGAIILEI